MTTFPELREAQRQVSEFKGDLDSDEFKNRIEVLRFRAALSADAVLAHIDAQAAEIERLREALTAANLALQDYGMPTNCKLGLWISAALEQSAGNALVTAPAKAQP